MNKLSQFLAERDEFKDFSKHTPVVIAPGRFNPPHRGHKLIIDKAIVLGKQLEATPVVLIIDSGKYSSRNPLNGDVRREYLQKMFPNTQFEVFRNAYEAVVALLNEKKMIPVGVVAGRDRASLYESMLRGILGKDTKYHVEVLHRDPDANGVKGISGTKVRKAAEEGNIPAFRAMTGLEDAAARTLMKMVVGIKHNE